MIYLNNAATSYPRLPQVVEAVKRSLLAPPQEPGRCGFEDPLMACRSAIAKLYGVADPLRVLLTTSATLGCNQILFGLPLQAGSHVITSCMEHNSVLRPLNELAARNECSLSVLPLEDDGSLSIDRVGGALRPDTRLMAFVHVSNVTGAIFPVQALALLAAGRNVPLLIDDSQGAGLVPLDLASLPGKVFLVAAGHKALQGPPGTGFFIVPDAVSLSPWITGGTGVAALSA
jgi:selenocysteine lyase/cysteine desulfurase